MYIVVKFLDIFLQKSEQVKRMDNYSSVARWEVLLRGLIDERGEKDCSELQHSRSSCDSTDYDPRLVLLIIM